MSVTVSPETSSWNTWYSRSESVACGGPSPCGMAPSASCSATSALMNAPPPATLRIADTSCVEALSFVR